MIDTIDTFRQGATAYRNARDWTKEQRDEAFKRANERANDSQVGTSAVNTGLSGVSSSTTKDSTLLNKGSNITADPPDSETSADELAIDYGLPAKRLRRHTKRSNQSQQKRRDDSESN